MTERPEFVPVFLQSATDIKEFLLSQIPDTWRKEVGDFPYDMIMPDVAQVMQLEIAQDRTLQNAFPQFCEDERMDEHMEIRGLTRIEATANKRVLSIVADPGVRIPQGYTFTSVVTDEEGNDDTKELSPIVYKKIAAILGTLSGVANYDDLTVNGGTADITIEPYEIPTVKKVRSSFRRKHEGRYFMPVGYPRYDPGTERKRGKINGFYIFN